MKITKRHLRRIIREAAMPPAPTLTPGEQMRLSLSHQGVSRNTLLASDDPMDRDGIITYLKQKAKSYHSDSSISSEPETISLLLNDDFLDDWGHEHDISDYSKLIASLSYGLSESALNERGTGNPALRAEERALMSTVVSFADAYMLTMGMNPGDPADAKRTRLAIEDIINGVMGGILR